MQKQNNNPKSHTNGRHSTPAQPVDVVFAIEKPEAREVYLCGDFNQWSPINARMFLRSSNHRWEKRLTLPPGRYEYKFLVDGEWVHDAKARENTPNVHGSLNSVVEVP